MCLDNTYLCFRENYYKQIYGVPMGSLISVTIANLVMEKGEQTALNTFTHPPWLWIRYVNDTFMIIKKDKIQTFHDHINGIEGSITFTIEIESDNIIAFLDGSVIHTEYGNLQTKMYRKPTQHTNRFLNYHSQHSINEKQALVKTLVHRAASKR